MEMCRLSSDATALRKTMACSIVTSLVFDTLLAAQRSILCFLLVIADELQEMASYEKRFPWNELHQVNKPEPENKDASDTEDDDEDDDGDDDDQDDDDDDDQDFSGEEEGGEDDDDDDPENDPPTNGKKKKGGDDKDDEEDGEDDDDEEGEDEDDEDDEGEDEDEEEDDQPPAKKRSHGEKFQRYMYSYAMSMQESMEGQRQEIDGVRATLDLVFAQRGIDSKHFERVPAEPFVLPPFLHPYPFGPPPVASSDASQKACPSGTAGDAEAGPSGAAYDACEEVGPPGITGDAETRPSGETGADDEFPAEKSPDLGGI